MYTPDSEAPVQKDVNYILERVIAEKHNNR